MANADLNAELRSLIDARLDAIEDVLRQVHVQNSERRHIVGEVETQIFEMLARRGENLTRDDVLAVLDSLDSPDCYIPEHLNAGLSTPGAGPDQNWARPPWPALLLIGVGLALLIDLVVAVIGLAGRELFLNENARETLVGVTVVLTALFAATGMVWRKRSKKPALDANYRRVAAVIPLLFVDYLFAVAISWSRGNLLLCLTLASTCLIANLLAIRHFWRSIPVN
jgi:hypothetical protein